MSELRAFFGPVRHEHPAGKPEAAARVGPLTSQLKLEQPDWKAIEDLVTKLLPELRSIDLALFVAVLHLRRTGWKGFQESLELLTHWLMHLWDQLYPELDMDASDLTERAMTRINRLASFSTRGYGDEFRIISLLEDAPLVDGIDRPITLKLIREAEAAEKTGITAELDLLTIKAAFRGPGSEPEKEALRVRHQEQVESNLTAINDTIALLDKADTFLREKAQSTPDWKELKEVLSLARSWLAGGLSTGISTESRFAGGGAPSAPATGVGRSSQPVQPGLTGAVTTRGEARKALESVCQYYREHEKSSPIPLIVGRALRLMDLDFIGLVRDLAPGAVDEVEKITGKEEKKETS